MTVRVSKVLLKGCPSDRSSFEGPPEGLSATPSKGLSDRLPEGYPGADEGVHPRGWEVVNPSCGDLHRRFVIDSTSAALRVGNEKDQTLYAVSIVILGWYVGRKFFVFCCITLTVASRAVLCVDAGSI